MRTPPPAVIEREAQRCATPPPKLALPPPMTAPPKPKPKPAPEPSIDELWALADACRSEYMPDLSSSPRSTEYDSDDEEGAAARSTVNACITFRLPSGTLHVCGPGHACKFAEPNVDRELVCKYTGVVVGKEKTEEFFDLNGGTGKRSGDPDQCCGEPQYGKWQRRQDPAEKSRLAFEKAEGVDSDDEAESWDVLAAKEATAAAKAASQSIAPRSSKRGARCVGEPDEAQPFTNGYKRARLSKKSVEHHGMINMLVTEAEQVLCKLIDYERSASYKQKRKDDRIERKRPPPDPRMCDEKFVFAASVKKYIKGCLVGGVAPSMDALHNLSLMAKRVSADARAEARAMDADALRTVKFRRACSEIIVALWKAACATPYMRVAKRGTDAFRPFVCGCIYGFKRGVTLADGSVLIPTCPALANALPALRGTGGNTLAKTLHSSSHRGLCTLSRCIASVPQDEQATAFDVVVRKARQFSATTFKATDI